MKRSLAALPCVIALSPLCVSAGAEGVQVLTERNGPSASPAFEFDKVPPPSSTDAGNVATFRVVAGERDGNAGRISVLNDGRGPEGSDEPDANFFFGRSLSGKLLVDLGEARDVQRIDSYSWHVAGRGPQVYKLYASHGEGLKLDATLADDVDPAAAGWQFVATVDSRPAGDEFGGQYGVSIAPEQGLTLGEFRYLLFDVAPPSATPFAATFFSEIDIHDGREHPQPDRGAVDVLKIGPHEIVFETGETPDLKPWVDAKLKPVCAEWYLKIVQLLPSNGYQAPRRLSITFYADMDGVAHAAGNKISCSADWFRNNLEGEATGAVVHELVHVVQQYRGANPSWAVEGVADYVRWFLYEPESERPRPDPVRANYDDSYRTTGHFLDYLTKRYDARLVPKLNALMREGRFNEEAWQRLLGKPVEALAAEWEQSLGGGQ